MTLKSSNIKRIESYLEYLPSSENPLSAIVYFIKGDEKTYIFDVGSNELSRKIIDEIQNKAIIISHFHADHMDNMKLLNLVNTDIYLGDYSFKVIGVGTVVKNTIEINDGVNLKIFSVQNSHAKGSLALIINDKYLLIGDTLCGNNKGFNVSLHNSLIKFLKESKYEFVLTSHDENIYTKDEIISLMESIYKRRSKTKPYISYEMLSGMKIIG